MVAFDFRCEFFMFFFVGYDEEVERIAMIKSLATCAIWVFVLLVGTFLRNLKRFEQQL